MLWSADQPNWGWVEVIPSFLLEERVDGAGDRRGVGCVLERSGLLAPSNTLPRLCAPECHVPVLLELQTLHKQTRACSWGGRRARPTGFCSRQLGCPLKNVCLLKMCVGSLLWLSCLIRHARIRPAVAGRVACRCFACPKRCRYVAMAALCRQLFKTIVSWDLHRPARQTQPIHVFMCTAHCVHDASECKVHH